jgi:hypothetical protein
MVTVRTPTWPSKMTRLPSGSEWAANPGAVMRRGARTGRDAAAQVGRVQLRRHRHRRCGVPGFWGRMRSRWLVGARTDDGTGMR